jgi:5-methylcytosine-specific restriction endonuclease McrA
MPIRPEHRQFYGADWRRYRGILLAIARNRCALCGAQLPSHQLAAAHVTHDPRDMELVRILCISCHSKNDARHSFAVARRTRARSAGQLWLLPELEWAAFPAWEIPRRVLRLAQGSLF